MTYLKGRRIVTGLFILSVALTLTIGLYVHSSEGRSVQASTPYSGTVTFLEHNMIANGSVVSGDAPFRSVNSPNYWFNANTRELNGNIDFPVNDQLLLIFGDGLTLQGNFGAGTGNELYGVYTMPVMADKAIIYYTDRTGNVGMYVDNRSVMLRPGQEFSYNETETVRDGNGTVRINYQHLYLNRGPIAINSIQTKMVV